MNQQNRTLGSPVRFDWRDATRIWWSWWWRLCLVFLLLVATFIAPFAALPQAEQWARVILGVMLVSAILFASYWAFRAHLPRLLNERGIPFWMTASRTLLACWACLWRFLLAWSVLFALILIGLGSMAGNESIAVAFGSILGPTPLASWLAVRLAMPSVLRLFTTPFQDRRIERGMLPRQRPRLGLVYLVLGGLLFVAGPIVQLAIPGRASLFGYLWMFLIFAVPALALIQVGRQHRVRLGRSISDTRKPILLLRPFAHDSSQAHLIFPTRQLLMEVLYALRFGGRYEDMLCFALREIGPVITLGEPGEKLPKTGAARIYFSRSDEAGWRQQVSSLLAESQLVLVLVGGSEGLAWEVGHAVTVLADTPDRLVLCLSQPRPETRNFMSKWRERERQRQYETFRNAHAEKFPRGLPETLGCAQFIRFERDWTPSIIRVGSDRSATEPADDVDKALLWLTEHVRF